MQAFNAALPRDAPIPESAGLRLRQPHQPVLWYIDGVHYNVGGMIQRNRLFATALATVSFWQVANSRL